MTNHTLRVAMKTPQIPMNQKKRRKFGMKFMEMPELERHKNTGISIYSGMGFAVGLITLCLNLILLTLLCLCIRHNFHRTAAERV